MSNKANTAVNANKYDLLVSLRNVRNFSLDNPILLLLIITAAVIALLYWFFGTEYGLSLIHIFSSIAMRISPSFCVKRRKGKTKCRFCVYYIAFWAKWQAHFCF